MVDKTPNSTTRKGEGGKKKKPDEKELNKYTERYRYWASHRIKQFSFSSNVMFVVGLAIFGYAIERQIPSKVVLILAFASIIVGILSMIARLYDQRITADIVLARKRFYKKNWPKTN